MLLRKWLPQGGMEEKTAHIFLKNPKLQMSND
jgi:hypothetical protein